MNQNTLMVTLISKKEQLNTFYQNRKSIMAPLFKGLVTFLVLYFMKRLFPYNPMANRTWVLGIITIAQAFLPISFLYYIVNAFIMVNLWKVSFDLCLAFFALFFILSICYYRIDSKYSYLTVLVPVFFALKIGILVPVVFAIAVGMHALVPVAFGIVIYFFATSISETVAVMAAEETANVGVGLIHVANAMVKNPTFLIFIVAACVAVVVTSFLRKMFHEQAWLISIFVGNIVMAGILIGCSMYLKMNIEVWAVLIEMVISLVICMAVEMLRGVGDVSRIEKTVFEDDEYIYYVKAVPKIKLPQSERNVKIINDTVSEEESEEEEAEEEQEISDEIIEDSLDEAEENKETIVLNLEEEMENGEE